MLPSEKDDARREHPTQPIPPWLSSPWGCRTSRSTSRSCRRWRHIESNQGAWLEQPASSCAAFLAHRSTLKLWHTGCGQNSAAAACQPRLRYPSQAKVFVGFVHLSGAYALRKAGDLNSVLIAMNVEMALHRDLWFLHVASALNFFAACAVLPVLFPTSTETALPKVANARLGLPDATKLRGY